MKKMIIPILTVLLCILALYLDYSDYTLVEAELEQDMYEKTSEIIGPEAKGYQLIDTYENGRLRFYSGEIFRGTQKIPVIYAYKKHWLLSSYQRSDYVLRYSDSMITHHGPQLKTVIFEYTAYSQDENLTLLVDRSFNYKTFLFIAAYSIAALLGKRMRG